MRVYVWEVRSYYYPKLFQDSYNDGTTETSEGLLDGYFLKDNPYWKIGIVSEKAKKEIGTSYKTFYNKLYNNLSFENLETNTVFVGKRILKYHLLMSIRALI